MALKKISSYQIAKLLTCAKFHLANLTIYHKKDNQFSYQVLFAKKAQLRAVTKNKLKRQIKHILYKLNFNQFKKTILIMVKSKPENFKDLELQILNLKKQLPNLN